MLQREGETMQLQVICRGETCYEQDRLQHYFSVYLMCTENKIAGHIWLEILFIYLFVHLSIYHLFICLFVYYSAEHGSHSFISFIHFISLGVSLYLITSAVGYEV